LKRAAAIFVDSDLGAQNMAKRYGIDMERIYVSPFDPAFFAHKRKYENQFNKEAVLEKYNIKTPYIFYPAQFWAHKNHIYVLEGLKILEQEYGISMGAVFCGVDYGNKKYVQELAQNLELLDRVYFVGYVSDDEMLTLYANSFALVMPTYFGPTNLPPLEAFILGIPVLYSDLPGMREQVKGAALLLDLLYPETMAIHLKNLSHDSALREKLTASGKRQMQDLAHRNNSQKALEKAFEKFFHKRKTWS
jgi:glycosyltransferase involved in cell wall biosynthesis